MTDKTKIISAFITSIIILILVGTYSFITIKNYKSSSNWVNHTHGIISETQHLLAYLQDIETSCRGYTISGQKNDLAPYHHAIKNIDKTFINLKHLTNDSQEQQQLMDSLQPLIAIKKDFTEQIIYTREKRGFEAAQLLILSNIAEDAMEGCRALIDKINGNAKETLSQRLQDSRESFVPVIITVISSIILSVIFILIAFYFFILDHNKRLLSENKVRDSELRLKSFLDALPIGVFVMKADDTPYYANEKAASILGEGIISNRSTGKPAQVHLAFEAGTDHLYPTEKSPGLRAIRSRDHICVEDMEILKNGRRMPLRINASPVYDSQGDITYSITCVEDITDIKFAAQELIKAKQQAEEALMLKDAFLANMSHEIRTPMNAIIGFTDILSKKNLGASEREQVETIKSAGENLLRIINDILDISKIEAKMMTFEDHPLSVMEIFKSLNTMLLQKAREKNLTLIFNCENEIPNVLLGDPTRLTQILINLINNAIKFTDTGTVNVSVKLLNEVNDLFHLEFSVSDTGIGIPEDKLQNIFERFRQAESHTTRNYGGTGLGLSIAKQLIELQGGHISIKSTVNEGSLFTFVLPFKKSSEDQNLVSNIDHNFDLERLKLLKVLLVEDNPINVKLVLSLFSDYHIGADVAENGKIAIDLIKANAYDLVLMDMEMPVMNGYDTTVFIRNELKNKIPIIAMTAHAMAGEKEKCLQLGMNDYISKPINASLLFGKIYKYLPKDTTPVLQKKVTDLSTLVKLMRGKNHVILETLEIFLRQVDEELPKIDEAVKNVDYLTIKTLIHKIKSSISMMGISSLEPIIQEIETHSKASNEIEKIAKLTTLFKTTLKQAAVEIETEKQTYQQNSHSV